MNVHVFEFVTFFERREENLAALLGEDLGYRISEVGSRISEDVRILEVGLRPNLDGDAGGVIIGEARGVGDGVALGDGVVAGEGVAQGDGFARREPRGDVDGERDGLI